MARALIGILGAYGAVGAATVRWVCQWCAVDVRLGGRRIEKIRPLAAAGMGASTAMVVDVDDLTALRTFCEGCAIVVNCVGPSHHVQDRVARAALAAGADYVDPGGDEPLHAQLASLDLASGRRRAILSAGAMPGLTGILPKWMAQQGFDQAVGLTVYTRLRNRFTRAAAIDYLLSDSRGYGERLAAWRDGRRLSRALEPLTDLQLSYFETPHTAYPYLSREADRTAAAIGLSDLRWYQMFDDQRFVSLAGRLQHEIAHGHDVTAAAETLVRAVDLELFGRESSVDVIMEMIGVSAGDRLERRMRFHSTDTYEASGAISALAVDAILAHTVAGGVHYAADILDPSAVVARVSASPAIGAVQLLEPAGDPAAILEDGSL